MHFPSLAELFEAASILKVGAASYHGISPVAESAIHARDVEILFTLSTLKKARIVSIWYDIIEFLIREQLLLFQIIYLPSAKILL